MRRSRLGMICPLSLVVLALILALAPSGDLAAAPARDAARPTPIAQVGGWVAPPVDVDRLMAEDVIDQQRPGVPMRVGHRMDVDLSTLNAGQWSDLRGGGQVWRLKVESPGALWLVLGFDRFRLQAGGELTVFDDARRTVAGPYGTTDVLEHGELWLPPIEGDTLIVELVWPEKLRGVEPALHLGTVSHGYRKFGTIGTSISETPGSSEIDRLAGPCNIDVNCPLGANWQNQKRGAVILLTSGGSSFCSGSLINTTANDCRPYVLTAAHCNAGASTQFGFNYERPGCGTGTAPPPTTQVRSGAIVRANFASSDATLLELTSPPPQSFNVYFPGWSRSTTAPTESWGIHFPTGDPKKISFNDDPLINGSNWGPNHWRVTEWEQGTTEPGSSGSPLFDQNQRIVGQLHGGTASCTSITYDEYGKLDASWVGGGTPATRLSDWLDPAPATGALTMNGVDWSTCAIQLAGTVDLTENLYSCSDVVAIALRDDHLAGQPSVTVAVRSTTEPTPETVTLTPVEPGSGRFAGTVNTIPGPPVSGDSAVSVAHGDTLTVRYVDANDGMGGMNVIVEDSALVDCAPPVITNVQATNVTGSGATITWTTNEPADSAVTYGLTPPGASMATSGALTTSHSVQLQFLQECSQYVFSVASADAAGNGASNNNGGAYYSFTTGINVQPQYTSTDTPIAIPDNNPTGATSTINVPDNKTVVDVDVVVNITHTYDGDLVVSLITPTNQTITLSNRRGGAGDNFVNTVFDDGAATAIAAGAAPFTGSFRPETPLSAANGINAAGAWRLRVVDAANIDVGTIDSWTLRLTYPAQACGPHAKYQSHALASDTCTAGGPGSGNMVWDAGETVQFRMTLENDGTDPISGVSATITPVTPGVVVLDGQADFPAMAQGTSAVSLAPHFTVRLPAGLSCGSTVQFAVAITTNQGSWNGNFSQNLGQTSSGSSTVLNETFAGGIPGTWTVVDGGTGGGAAATWTTANPGNRTTLTAPFSTPFAIVDSDNAGQTATQDEQLITPTLNLAACTQATVRFDNQFRWFSGGQAERGDVDVSTDGATWTNVLRIQGASDGYLTPNSKTVDITAAIAANPANTRIRFRYYQAQWEFWWAIDNVRVDCTAPSGCAMNGCAAPPAAPPPVPASTTVGRLDAAGNQLQVTWSAPCAATSTKILYGPLGQVATHAVSGAACGASSPYTWNVATPGDLWFVVVNENGAGAEGSWGLATAGERNGTGASGTCGSSTKDLTGTCP